MKLTHLSQLLPVNSLTHEQYLGCSPLPLAILHPAPPNWPKMQLHHQFYRIQVGLALLSLLFFTKHVIGSDLFPKWSFSLSDSDGGNWWFSWLKKMFRFQSRCCMTMYRLEKRLTVFRLVILTACLPLIFGAWYLNRLNEFFLIGSWIDFTVNKDCLSVVLALFANLFNLTHCIH